MITYYELRGTGEEKNKYPSGMFRKIETDNYLSFERVDENGAWVEDFEVYRHLVGHTTDAFEITKERAEEVLAYFRKGEKRKPYGTSYFELRGTGPKAKEKYPSGMFRVVWDETSMFFERMDGNGNWVKDSEMGRYLSGYSDDAYEITKEWADEVLEHFRKRKKKK